MPRTTPPPWHGLEATLERMADSIKDLLLDGFECGEADPTEPALEELPPLPKEAFLAVLRPRVEEALGRLADALNETPDGKLCAAREDHLIEPFARLWCEALELGEQMRGDAASSPLPFGPPQGEWARRYRRMHAASFTRLPYCPRTGD